MIRRTFVTVFVFGLLVGLAWSQDRSYRYTYKPSPRSDISDDPTYVHLLRYCDTNQMEKAEARAAKLLDEKGYRGTRFECTIWLALARSYERQGNRAKALDDYIKCYCSCDSRKGPWHAAVAKIPTLGGTVPRQPCGGTAPVQPAAPTQAAPTPAAPPAAPLAPATPATVSGQLKSDADYQQATSEIRAGQSARDPAQAHSHYWAALTLLKKLVTKYNGTADESALHALMADLHLTLASSHYRWVQQSAQGSPGPHVNRSRQRTQQLAPMVQQGIPTP
jgi:hypothetical protein